MVSLLKGMSIREFKFGVPKHSELEPDYFLAKGNGKPPQTAASPLRFADGNAKLIPRVIIP